MSIVQSLKKKKREETRKEKKSKKNTNRLRCSVICNCNLTTIVENSLFERKEDEEKQRKKKKGKEMAAPCNG